MFVGVLATSLSQQTNQMNLSRVKKYASVDTDTDDPYQAKCIKYIYSVELNRWAKILLLQKRLLTFTYSAWHFLMFPT